jgi:hypothetical protein
VTRRCDDRRAETDLDDAPPARVAPRAIGRATATLPRCGSGDVVDPPWFVRTNGSPIGAVRWVTKTAINASHHAAAAIAAHAIRSGRERATVRASRSASAPAPAAAARNAVVMSAPHLPTAYSLR